jgi:hypothetical protein
MANMAQPDIDSAGDSTARGSGGLIPRREHTQAAIDRKFRALSYQEHYLSNQRATRSERMFSDAKAMKLGLKPSDGTKVLHFYHIVLEYKKSID